MFRPRMSRPGRLLSVLLLSTTLVTPVLAAEVNPAQATRLEGQLREWLASFAIPGLTLSNRPIRLVPEGDHYQASIPLGETNPITITATLRPQDGDRWAIEHLRLPSPANFTLTLPSDEKNADGTPKMETVNYTVKAAEQDASGVFDPNFRTPSNLHSTYRALTVQADFGGKVQNTQVGRIVSDSTIRPATAGRVDVLSTGVAESYVAASTLPDDTPLRIEADKVSVNSLMSGVSTEKATQVTRGLFSVLSAIIAKGKSGAAPDPTDMDPAMVRALLVALKDFASDARVDETLQGLRVRIGDNGGNVDTVTIGFSAASPTGMLTAGLDLGMEGLKIVNPPLGPLETFVPKRFTIRPTIAGVATEDLYQIADSALNTPPGGQPDTDAMVQRLFSKGGLVVGLENLAIDVAGASFTGQGKFNIPSPDSFSGEGRISVTNLDTLIKQVQDNPLTAQAVPAFVFAKGVGRASGNTVVWDLSYKDNRLLVNGTDLSAMAGMGNQAPKR